MAALVYTAAPGRPVNRWLAILLLFEGIMQSVCHGGLNNFVTDPAAVRGMGGVDLTAGLVLPWIYLVFLGYALDTPLVRPLRRRPVQVALGVLLAGVLALRFLRPEAFMAGFADPVYAEIAFVPGPWWIRAYQWWGVVSLFGLIATLDAYRRSASDLARRRNRAYAVAFGLRDAWWVFALLFVIPYVNFHESMFWSVLLIQGLAATGLAFTLLLGYGILKTQLFDIDLKLKWTLQRGTVAGAFVAAFFVVSELASSLLSDQMGTVTGVLAAGALVFAMSPLHRLADRVSNAAMPHVTDTPGYLQFRKLEVYQAAVESALTDGVIAGKERDVLDTLRDKLGIAAPDAEALERDVLAGAAKGAGS